MNFLCKKEPDPSSPPPTPLANRVTLDDGCKVDAVRLLGQLFMRKFKMEDGYLHSIASSVSGEAFLQYYHRFRWYATLETKHSRKRFQNVRQSYVLFSLFQALWQCRRGRLAGSGREKGEVKRRLAWPRESRASNSILNIRRFWRLTFWHKKRSLFSSGRNEVFKTMLTGSPALSLFLPDPARRWSRFNARSLFRSSSLTESLEQANVLSTCRIEIHQSQPASMT